jgi:8-oxo-dGTP pyrophosphatase MutT (NUDIX family)/phosphohistidine phosphatase SixA
MSQMVPDLQAAALEPAPIPPATPAAGALPWRRRGGVLQVAMVHRPRYDDWSWAKGKLDDGEEWPAAAVREVAEETGYDVHLGRPLPTSTYPIGSLSGLATKEVRYWAAEVIGGSGKLVNEIDDVAWLSAEEAALRLDYARDKEQLRALVQAADGDELTTWPLAVVRHAKANPRGSWEGPDPLRPLDARGQERALALAPILAAFGIKRLISSPSNRCLDTLRPYAAQARITMRSKAGLSEEGFALDPSKAPYHVERMVQRGSAVAVCGHGPVLPAMFAVLEKRADPEMADRLHEAADLGLAKGEVLVAHLSSSGEQARVVAVERHAPSD